MKIYYSLKSSKSLLSKDSFRRSSNIENRKKVSAWLVQGRVTAPPAPAVTPDERPSHGLKSLLQVNPVYVAKIKHKSIFLPLCRPTFYNATKYKVKK